MKNPILTLHKLCEGDGVVSLVIPRPGYGDTINLLPGRRGPRGRVMTGDEKKTVAVFDRKRVRKYLEKTFPESFDRTTS